MGGLKGKISFIFSEEFDCYMLRVDLENKKYFLRLLPEGKQSPYATDSCVYSDSDSGVSFDHID